MLSYLFRNAGRDVPVIPGFSETGDGDSNQLFDLEVSLGLCGKNKRSNIAGTYKFLSRTM